MAVNLETRSTESAAATEIYISATPTENASAQAQAEEIFSAIAETLRSKRAFILQERIFATASAMETIRRIRANTYGDIDDGVDPSFLVSKQGLSGPIAGVQLYTISSDNPPDVFNLDRCTCGRVFRSPNRTCLTLSGLSAPHLHKATEQAQAILEMAEASLKQFGSNFLSVPRTWMWLGDILAWYGDFNQVRSRFFTARGLIGEGTRKSMPASTGIGLGPDNGGKCSMDLLAILEPSESIEYLQAAGKQQCAFEYGSAFSRSTRAITPAGETVFISGTASIDASGETTNIGQPAEQIKATIENVHAALRDMNCNDEDVVQVVAYCKTIEVEKVFNTFKNTLAWPWVTVICDICRPDLLFEIEAAAMPRH
jgi:enamine deaminase RidA (YjgF/YER057c/UK114 family)